MKYTGSCHCQKVRYEVELDLAQEPALTCNCSMCQRKGSMLRFVPAGQFTLVSGAENLTDYQFGAKKIHHYFCSTCGVTSFATGQTPDGTKMQAINVRCLDGVDLESLKTHHIDGRSF